MTSSPEQNNTNPENLKTEKPRAQLRHILLDVDFFNKPKIIALEEQFDSVGTHAVIAILCSMSRATNAVISSATIAGIVKRSGIKDDQFCDFLDYCLSEGIFIKEEKGYTNSRVVKDQEAYGGILERDRNRKKKSKRNPKGIRRKHKGKSVDSDIDIDTDINTDLNINNKKLYGKFVYLSDEQYEKYKTKFGQQFLNRCIEKLDSWIESAPTKIKIKNGKNAAACFNSWVANSVAEEQARAGKLNGNQNKGKSVDPRINVILNSLGEQND